MCWNPSYCLPASLPCASLGFIEDPVTKPAIEIMISASPTDLPEPRKSQAGRFLHGARIHIACNLAKSKNSGVKRRNGKTLRDMGRTPRSADPAHVVEAGEGGPVELWLHRKGVPTVCMYVCIRAEYGLVISSERGDLLEI